MLDTIYFRLFGCGVDFVEKEVEFYFCTVSTLDNSRALFGVVLSRQPVVDFLFHRIIGR